MLFSIAMALMVILVAGFWTYQGFFSSVLMFFECAIACAAAFGFYEALYSVAAASIGSGIGLPLAFTAIFLAVLVILRLATDRLFPENVNLPLIADRAGAGVFGVMTGLLLVGTALVGVQMLPVGSSIFGFDRVKVEADGSQSKSDFLLGPDSFAVGMANKTSSGGFGGSNPLRNAKPDLLMDLYSGRAAVQSGDREEIPADSIKVNSYWETRQIDQVKQRLESNKLAREFETLAGKFLVFDVSIDRSACAKDKSELYLRVPQFRLVGPPQDGTGGSPTAVLACGMSDVYIHKGHGWPVVQENQATRLVRFRPETEFVLGPGQTAAVCEQSGKGKGGDMKGFRINVAFEAPDGFEPWYLAFKNGAKCEINKQRMFKETPPKTASLALGNTGPGRTAEEIKPKEGQGKVGKAPGGATHVASAKGAFVTDKLPYLLPKKNSAVRTALKGGRLGECHLFIELPKEEPPKTEQVSEFDVPEDKKLVMIDADRNQALSLYGRALNYASNVVAQITLTTADGTTYFAQGVYSMAKQGGKTYFEIQYHPEADVPERCLEKAKKVTAAMLQSAPSGDRSFGYIFVVDPGVKIINFGSGGTGGKQSVEIEVPK